MEKVELRYLCTKLAPKVTSKARYTPTKFRHLSVPLEASWTVQERCEHNLHDIAKSMLLLRLLVLASWSDSHQHTHLELYVLACSCCDHIVAALANGALKTYARAVQQRSVRSLAFTRLLISLLPSSDNNIGRAVPPLPQLRIHIMREIRSSRSPGSERVHPGNTINLLF